MTEPLTARQSTALGRLTPLLEQAVQATWRSMRLAPPGCPQSYGVEALTLARWLVEHDVEVSE
jgi:hypothetical protein